MKLHRVARLFPDMTTQQFNDLVEDIRKNGQIEPILLCSGKIADGRHRYKACNKLKIEAKMVRWEDVRPSKDASIVDYVISRNLRRRHLTKSQRAAIATEALPLYEEEAKAKMKRAGAKGGKASGEARKKQVEETKGPAKLQDPSPAEEPETTEEKKAAPAKKAKKAPKDRASESTAKAAKQAGVSQRYVAEAAAIKKKSLALYKLVESGEVAIPLAKKIADLDPPHLKIVLREGKKHGYKKALDDFLAQFRPKDDEPSQRDLVTKLKRATKQAEALNATLSAAAEMAKKLNIEKGQGLINLIELTDTANQLARQIAKD
ncbi:MAG: ParB N-terminal domain-containing protein [Anaerolineae bacterium]|nr:ParB N-terminal domain-containing protein [Anaerolineae bacterium]